MKNIPEVSAHRPEIFYLVTTVFGCIALVLAVFYLWISFFPKLVLGYPIEDPFIHFLAYVLLFSFSFFGIGLVATSATKLVGERRYVKALLYAIVPFPINILIGTLAAFGYRMPALSIASTICFVIALGVSSIYAFWIRNKP